MRNFDFVNMPNHFTRFLQADMHIASKSYNLFKSEVYNNPSINSLFNLAFRDIDPNLDVDMVMKSMGWEGFRNRLTCQYLNYANTGNFNQSVDENLCSEILHFEKVLRKYSVSGYSRGFQLGFYLKLWSKKPENLKSNARITDLVDLTGVLIEILDRTKSKVIAIDWVVVVLSQLLNFLNKDIVMSLFTDEMTYIDLYQILDVHQKRNIMSNLLSYGSSINDQEIFIPAIQE